MGVYIKRINIPSNCTECGQFMWSIKLQTDVCKVAQTCGYNGMFRSWTEGTENRPPWCPLIPVPKHGRLIDVDALIEVLNNNKVTTLYELNYFLMNAPTIIPVDQNKEG